MFKCSNKNATQLKKNCERKVVKVKVNSCAKIHSKLKCYKRYT